MRVASLCLALAALAVAACGPVRQACDARSCATGCCDSAGRCTDGRSALACGSGGVACVSCGLTASCVNGTCAVDQTGSGGGVVGGGTAGGSVGGGAAGGTAGGITGGGSAGGMGAGAGDAGTATDFCRQLDEAQQRFFDGNSQCRNRQGAAVGSTYDISGCLAGFDQWCTSSADQRVASDLLQCVQVLPVCRMGESDSAYDAFLVCGQRVLMLSTSCAYAIGPK